MDHDSWMFRELTDPSPNLVRILASFEEMLRLGSHIVGLACEVLLHHVSVDDRREQILRTEEDIDELERFIRRKLTVHAMAYGADEIPTCLGMMSIVKDAERIGDYGHGLFRLAEGLVQQYRGIRLADMRETSGRILSILAEGRDAIERRDAEAARSVIEACTSLRRHCDQMVAELVQQPDAEPQAVACALAYRRLHRVASHLRNIQTVLVQPIDKLDFVP